MVHNSTKILDVCGVISYLFWLYFSVGSIAVNCQILYIDFFFAAPGVSMLKIGHTKVKKYKETRLKAEIKIFRNF